MANGELPKTYQFRGMMIEKVSNIEKTLEKLETNNTISHEKLWKKIDKVDRSMTNLAIKVGVGGGIAGFIGGVIVTIVFNTVG